MHVFSLSSLIADISKFRWVVLKESARSCFWFTLLHTLQTSDMNAITSRAVFSAYPSHMKKKISLPNNIVGDSTSAASNMNERQQIQELGPHHPFMTPCGGDCPSVSRVTTDLKGFGQFVYCPSRGPPMPNPRYIWSRDSMCYNQRCDNYEIFRDLPELPSAPYNLYLTADMNGTFFSMCKCCDTKSVASQTSRGAANAWKSSGLHMRHVSEKPLEFHSECVCGLPFRFSSPTV